MPRRSPCDRAVHEQHDTKDRVHDVKESVLETVQGVAAHDARDDHEVLVARRSELGFKKSEHESNL
jgi:hypothetical protein